ncbi:MAG: SHOCT domain-containing protein [Hyphomicrobiales bacterium]|nr:SHOCT domain-containing protein [Hyphomicrobiales bacterium]MCP5371542.1 SHOCT domain-containing protein [Hyphomicrobiales bacterium]
MLTVSALALGLSLGMAGCSAIQDGSLFQESFWAGSPMTENVEAELGLAELAKGNYITAEAHFQKALKRNRQDVHALIGSALLYHGTGQLVRAREMYEAVIALRPKESEQFVVWRDLKTRPIAEIASVNLALMESGGVVSGLGGNGAGAAQAAAVPSGYPAGEGVAGAANGMAMTARMAPSAGMAPGSMAGGTPVGAYGKDDANIISRFTTLRALRDQNLITQDEYASRRRANVGALLPLSAAPPALGLDRPVPTTEQISGRLRAIGRALEMRAITVSQHANERTMILEALMPAAPASVAAPGVPPQGLMAAADAVRRIEKLRDDGFITSDEYARERAAIESGMQAPPGQPAKPKPGMAAAGAGTASAAMAGSGPRPGVHLASYRSQRQAERGWQKLIQAHRALLGGLEPNVTRVNLGRGKGIFFRLKAGPVASKAAAADLCRKLKSRRQYCQPTIIEAG